MSKESFSRLYEAHKATINDVHRRCRESGHRIIGPYLVEPNDAYLNAKRKVVFVGQETGDWEESDCDIPRQLDCYRNFNQNGRADGSVHPGAFYNVIRKLEKELTGSSHACVALNLNRYSQGGRRPSWQNQTIMAELDFLVSEELKLLQPDVVVFFTGPHYDPRVHKLLVATASAIDPFPSRQLSRIHSKTLGGVICRTYHPTYLRRRHFESGVIAAIQREVAKTSSPDKSTQPTEI